MEPQNVKVIYALANEQGLQFKVLAFALQATFCFFFFL